MLPNNWYVLYADKEEFDILVNHFAKHWSYYKQTTPPIFGYTNVSGHNNWVNATTYQDLRKKNAIEISFNQFRKEVLKEYIVSDKDYNKCLKRILKKLKIK